jgi:hypothetical protein
MFGVLVTFQYGDDFDAGRLRAVAEKASPQFQDMPGLRSKAFTLDEENRRAQNFYVWDSAEAAKAFFSDALRERVTGLYGVAPSVAFMQIVALVDNGQRQVERKSVA